MINVREMTMYEACLLHSRADRNLRDVVAKQLDNHKLTMMQWLMLATVCDHPGKGMTMSEVAKVLDVSLPQVTALMNDLVKAKYLRQKISNEDRRSRRLTCTIAGKRLAGKIESSINESMKNWLRDIPKDQLSSYMQTVEALAERNTP